MIAEQHKSANDLAADRTGLATRRTLMAADRTLMAWLRTALSMISFGFTIYKILEGLQGQDDSPLAQEFDPRTIGGFLAALGTISIVMGTLEYWFTVRDLRELMVIRIWRRPSFIMALVICIGGMVVFFSIITRLL